MLVYSENNLKYLGANFRCDQLDRMDRIFLSRLRFTVWAEVKGGDFFLGVGELLLD